MPTNISDTLTAAGAFPTIEGPIAIRKYNPLPTLPSSGFPAGTVVRDLNGNLQKVSEDGNSWSAVGGLFLPLAGGAMAGDITMLRNLSFDPGRQASLSWPLAPSGTIPGSFSIQGQQGGNAQNNIPPPGADFFLTAGTGGWGAGNWPGGAGGRFFIRAGRGNLGTSTGANGVLYLGDDSTAEVQIGAAAVPVTLPGATIGPATGQQHVLQAVASGVLALTSDITTAVGAYLPLAGGTMNGFLQLASGIGLTGAATHGTLTWGPQLSGDAHNNLVYKYAPAEVASDPFYMWFGEADLPPAQTRADQVMVMGWNCNSGGGRMNSAAGHGAVGIAMEQFFLAGHPPGQTELHLLGVDNNGIQTRYLSALGFLDGGGTKMFLAATEINVGSGVDGNALPSIAISPTTMVLSSPSGLRNIVLDDAGGRILTIQNGTAIAPNTAHLVIDPNGNLEMTVAGVGRLYGPSAALAFQWAGGGNTAMFSSDGLSKVEAGNGSGVIFTANGNPVATVQPSDLFLNNIYLYSGMQNIGSATRADLGNGYLMRTNTAALNGAQQQNSPPIIQTGYAWSGIASRSSTFTQQNVVVPGSPVGGKLTWAYSSDEANTTPVATLDQAGNLSLTGTVQISDGGNARPAAGSSQRGKFWIVDGAGGAADVVYMCLKKADDTYAWVQVATG